MKVVSTLICQALAVGLLAALCWAPVPALAVSQQYLTLQVATFSRESNANRFYEALRERLSPDLYDQVRVEQIRGLYAFRLGRCEDEICLETLWELVSEVFPDVQRVRARILPERIVQGHGAVDRQTELTPVPMAQGAGESVSAEADSLPPEPIQREPDAVPTVPVVSESPHVAGGQMSVSHAQASELQGGNRVSSSVEKKALPLSVPWVRYFGYLALGLLALAVVLVVRKKSARIKGSPQTSSSAQETATGNEPMTESTTLRPEDETMQHIPGLSEADEEQLRTNLAELVMIQGNIQGKDKNVRTVYVTSCFNGEGKTRAVINMGHGMSINHSRILLVDGNPRAPQLHKKYGIPSAPGLMDVLFMGTSPDEAIHETKYRDLYVMPFGQGPPGRPNMLKDNILRDWLDRMKETYDFIIMDGHSQIGSSDGPLVASIFDGTVLVVECEKTKWEVLQDASKKIALLGGQPLGLVLNKRKFYIPRMFYGRK